MSPTQRPPAQRALTPTEVITGLTRLNGEQAQGWRVMDNALEKSFHFADFHRTMAFANAVAYIAHVQDHHPELRLDHGRCTVRWTTHDLGGLSARDFSCATQVDALMA